MNSHTLLVLYSLHLLSCMKPCVYEEISTSVRLSKAKCKLLHMDQHNPTYVHGLEELLESNLAEKDLGIPVDRKAVYEVAVHACNRKVQQYCGLH